MTIEDLQGALGLVPDGQFGRVSRAAFMAAFLNRAALGVTVQQIADFAARLGCTVKQLMAVACVESGGSGFDLAGRPKILFERHKFHRFTGGRWSVCAFSNPAGGGYGENSWDKLALAVATGAVDAAFMACSWGKFQVLGEWWDDLGYASPFAMAMATVGSEAAHYEMLCRYLEHFHLQDELAALSTDPATCRPFAAAYNGAGYKKFAYDAKLAGAMR